MLGSAHADGRRPGGPGLVLEGGRQEVAAAWRWLHDTLAGGGRRGGDLLLLTPERSGAIARYANHAARFNSVRALHVPPGCNLPADIGHWIDRAGAVFFAGGEAADYAGWKSPALAAAIARLYRRGGIVGGSAAGAGLLGQFVFDPATSAGAVIGSRLATLNPYDARIRFKRRFLALPPLENAIVEWDFVRGDRFGRLTAFMARLVAERAVSTNPPRVLGVGIDAGSALVIDRKGSARLLRRGANGAALLLQMGPADHLLRGDPLIANNVQTTLMKHGEAFDFTSWCASAPTYFVGVDGDPESRRHYVPNPYVDNINAAIPHC